MDIVVNNDKPVAKYGEKIDVALMKFRKETSNLRDNLRKTAESELARCQAIADIAGRV